MGCIRSQLESNEQKGLLHKPLLPRHRTINQCQYPQAYQAWAAPYQNKSPYHNRINFNSIVLRNCLQNKIEVNRLKACKIVLVGDQGVGKTSLLHRYCDDIFEVARPYKSTISMGYEVRAFEILSIPYNVQIWDTAGERRWQEIAVDYCRYVDVVIMVFDFHDFNTLGNIEKWKRLVDEKVTEAFFFLVGSKKDIVKNLMAALIN